MDSERRSPDIFSEVAAYPDQVRDHHQMLMSYAVHDYSLVPSCFRLRGNERVIDAGGGLGTLAQLMVAEYPDLHIIILDLPEVTQQASKCKLNDHVELQGCDFFKPWGIKADAVVMARVLHDWDDSKAVQLLRHAHSALPKGGKLFVVEMLLSEDSMMGSLCDLHLLIATGGAERTVSHYASLLEEAGFALDDVRRIAALPSILVGVAQ